MAWNSNCRAAVGRGSKWRTVEYPDGRVFEGIGIRPQVTVSPVSDIRQGKDAPLERAIELLREGSPTH